MYKQKKHVAMIGGLAAASATALTLGIVLPICMRDHVENETQYIQFNGLDKQTDFSVGQNIKLDLKLDPSVNTSGYEFKWYVESTNQQLNKQNPRLMQTTTAPSLQISDAQETWDGAMIYCLISPKEANGTNSSSQYFKSGLIQNACSTKTVIHKEYWTETTLHLTDKFQIQSLDIGVQKNKNAIIDQANHVILTTANNTITLTANTKVATEYEPYIKYQWYLNGKPVQGATTSIYTITNPTANDSVYCEAKLVASDQETSSVVKTSVYSFNIVKSFALTVTASVTNKSESKPTAQTSITNNLGDKFTLTATPKWSATANNQLPQGYEYSYQWQVANYDLDNPNWNNLGGSSSSPTLNNQTSEFAGNHYYRCNVSIVETVTNQIIQTVSSSIVTINTCPQVKLTSSSQPSVVPPNGFIRISPNIQTVSSLVPQPVGPGHHHHHINLEDYHPVYQWYYNGTAVTDENVHNYKFLANGLGADGVHGPVLNINTLGLPNDAANGEYSVTVTINNVTYKINSPIKVVNSAPTYKVTATATGLEGSNQITISTKVTPIAPTTKADLTNLTYWYFYWDGQTSYNISNVQVSESSITFNTTDGSELNSNMNGKYAFYVLVYNSKGEIEYNAAPGALLQVLPKSSTSDHNTNNQPVVDNPKKLS